jgi:hypothetical protein
MRSHSMSRCLHRYAPAILLLASVAACGPLRRGAGPLPTSIIFRNEALDQAAVYVVSPDLDSRLIGTVFPGRTRTLTVPSDMANVWRTVNIVARLPARWHGPQTGPVPLRRGDQYLVTLPLNAELLWFRRRGLR